jgi:hypothetical protein
MRGPQSAATEEPLPGDLIPELLEEWKIPGLDDIEEGLQVRRRLLEGVCQGALRLGLELAPLLLAEALAEGG